MKVGKVIFTFRRSEAGMPQEAVLSPLLYSIYTVDIPKSDFPKDRTVMALYIAYQVWQPILAKRRVLIRVKILANWYLQRKRAITVDKNEALLIQSNRSNRPEHIVIHGHRIPWKRNARYQRMINDNKTLKRHFQKI